MAQDRTASRPTEYRKRYDKCAFMLCLMGATDKDLSKSFDVSESTINLWKLKHKTFSESIKAGREEADSKVSHSLYERAIGYNAPDTHIAQYEGKIIKTPLIKHYPPEVTACIFWLKNRRPKQFRDKQEITVDGTVTIDPQTMALAKQLADSL